jgi:predicted Zn-ribbon and HTH transcriptional regulator
MEWSEGRYPVQASCRVRRCSDLREPGARKELTRIEQKSSNTVADERDNAAIVWHYAACANCTSKWFSPLKPSRCPRCGSFDLRVVEESPPWHFPKKDSREERW